VVSQVTKVNTGERERSFDTGLSGYLIFSKLQQLIPIIYKCQLRIMHYVNTGSFVNPFTLNEFFEKDRSKIFNRWETRVPFS